MPGPTFTAWMIQRMTPWQLRATAEAMVNTWKFHATMGQGELSWACQVGRVRYSKHNNHPNYQTPNESQNCGIFHWSTHPSPHDFLKIQFSEFPTFRPTFCAPLVSFASIKGGNILLRLQVGKMRILNKNYLPVIQHGNGHNLFPRKRMFTFIMDVPESYVDLPKGNSFTVMLFTPVHKVGKQSSPLGIAS